MPSPVIGNVCLARGRFPRRTQARESPWCWGWRECGLKLASVSGCEKLPDHRYVFSVFDGCLSPREGLAGEGRGAGSDVRALRYQQLRMHRTQACRLLNYGLESIML